MRGFDFSEEYVVLLIMYEDVIFVKKGKFKCVGVKIELIVNKENYVE